jgi:hypothetical protein
LPEIEEAEDMVSIEEAEDMVSLRRNVTGVDATVFVSTKGYGQHAPACIQIAVGDPASLNAVTAGLAPMAIRDCALTGAAPPPHIVEQAKQFIERNRETLLSYWDGQIDTAELVEQLGRAVARSV